MPNTYVLIWYADEEPWPELPHTAAAVQAGFPREGLRPYVTEALIMPGDRLFLLRRGRHPEGVFGSGLALDTERIGGLDHVRVEFDALLDPLRDLILSTEWLRLYPELEELLSEELESGSALSSKVVRRLEFHWGLAASPASRLAQEIIRPDLVPEHIRRAITVNAYEHSSLAINLCVKAHGMACVVCGFDFARVYGLEEHAIVQVHHIVPLDEIGPDYQFDPVEDLVPVCPNCHLALHSVDPPYTIAQLRRMLQAE